jgi:hypothetical protein
VFIKNFENKVTDKPFTIERLNIEKYKNKNYGLDEIYEDYEVWVKTPKGWKAKKV